jgi:hypothetical protein
MVQAAWHVTRLMPLLPMSVSSAGALQRQEVDRVSAFSYDNQSDQRIFGSLNKEPDVLSLGSA